MPAEPAGLLQVDVVYSPSAGHMDLVSLVLRQGVCLSEALDASGLLTRHGLEADQLRVGIWGKARMLDTPLRQRDRVEIYRPLQVDPKEARRQRYGKGKAGRTQARR